MTARETAAQLRVEFGLGDSGEGTLRRALEESYKRGHDAGVAHQRGAKPPLKAREYRDQAVEARAELANLRARVGVAVTTLLSSVSLHDERLRFIIDGAREELESALAESLGTEAKRTPDGVVTGGGE